MKLWLADEAATLEVGAALGRVLEDFSPSLQQMLVTQSGGLHLHLHGGLGAGKTTLVRGLLRAMGVQGAVKSPTYTLVEPYQTTHWEVFHFDLYRLGNADEMEFFGVRDYFRQGALCIFEWPARGAGALPAPSLVLTLAVENDGRQLLIEAGDRVGKALAGALKNVLSC